MFEGRVPLWVSWVYCHCVIVSLWVFCGSKIFYPRFFMSLKYVLVGTSSIQNILVWVFLGSNFLFVGILWVQNYFSWIFCVSNIFARRYFVSPNFFSWHQNFLWSVISNKNCHILYLKYIWNWLFYSKLISTIIYITKVLHSLNYVCYHKALGFANCIWIHLFY